MMNKTLKYTLIWIFAVVFTLATAVYQKRTGPTYPMRGEKELAGQKIKFQLIRSYDLADEAKVTVIVPDTSVKGDMMLRRFKSYDKWVDQPMQRHGDTLIGLLPHLPPAGKIMYEVTLSKGDQKVKLNDRPAVLRYTGYVPRIILVPHIFFMFFGMLFSTLAALMVLAGSRRSYLYAWITVIFVGFGGLVLGPIVQKYAFDAYWTGWPFGHDLTDNKSIVAFLFWVGGLYALHKNREAKLWPVIAAIALLVVFSIPHSMLGSEIDYTKEAPAVETTR